MPKAKKGGGRKKKVCPKRHAGKKVHAAKGRCYVKTPVKKVARGKGKGAGKKGRKGCKHGKTKAGTCRKRAKKRGKK